eukprot:GHVU01089881.1.p1 GENE.GHVU01089881.1~~GHVU01089881.1.p1  ORF type:complete len:150 (-),score=16.81 GHVU01089881.1:72-521(-)
MYGGRFLNGVSLRRCHNTAGVTKITITVVSATHQHISETFTVEASEDMRQLNDDRWLSFVKEQIEEALQVESKDEYIQKRNEILLKMNYKRNKSLNENSLDVYMRHPADGWMQIEQRTELNEGWLPTSIIVTGPEGTWPGCVCVRSRAI